jgi:signal transduction histidine kinase
MPIRPDERRLRSPMTEATPRQSGGGRFSQWTLRQRVGRASAAMLALLAVLFTVIVVSLIDFKSKGDDLINRWQPAYSTSQDLLADLVNQETAVRGFALGKNESFLQPYTDYRALQAQHLKTLTGYVAGHPELIAALNNFATTADQWRAQIASPYIARVRANDPTVTTAPASDAAKAAFDKIRAASARLTSALGTVRNQAKSERISSVTLVWASVGVSAALILLAGFALWRGLRNSVLSPVEQLATQTRQVAQGAIDKKIVGAGPPEIAGLGDDVDTMRARIANELARVELARVRLLERTDELARSNADLEQFAYVASHDLSEPLRKVANFCQLLERQYGDELDDKAKQYIQFAVDGAKRMQVLIADLLSFSRVGRTTETFAPVDTNIALSRALANLDDRIVAADAEIVRGSLPTIDGDVTLIVALFQNLVGNSLKYRSTERTARIEISAEKQGPSWQFTLADNGIGIEKKYGERIFTIFQRLHLRDQYGGTGIGLALCRKIVEFHRGRIWLGDSDGPGASFQFVLPEHGDPGDAVDR